MTDPRIITFGCRLNSFESEVMRQHAQQAGLSDVVIINTCAVTTEAVRQAGQAIRKARRERPDAQIVVTGCAAQAESARFADMPEVDRVLGNAEKMQRASWQGLAACADGGASVQPRVQVGDIMGVRDAAPTMIDGFSNRTRASVEIQNGCDHRCTFCIIPYGRGPSRSVPAEHVVAQVRRLVEAGYAEIILTGVDMTSYGADAGGGTRLGDLVRRVLREIADLKRLRLSSIDSIEADPALIRAMAEENRLMPHLHLSLQAGDDMILKRMKRRHSRADSVSFCEAMRRLRPDIVFGADLIAGFPTETDAMFANSTALIADCGLTYLHVFPFSPRPGTPAARMPQLPRDLIKQRAATLRAHGQDVLRRFLERQRGDEVDVVIERAGLGRTEQFAELEYEARDGPQPDVGTFARMRVTGRTGTRLTGQVLA